MKDPVIPKSLRASSNVFGWFLVSWSIQSQSPVNFSQVPHLFSERLGFCGHDHKFMFSESLPHQLKMINITTNILEKDF